MEKLVADMWLGESEAFNIKAGFLDIEMCIYLLRYIRSMCISGVREE